MNDKSLERVLDDILNDMNEVFILLTKKIEELEQDLIEVEKHREESIKLAFDKGYEIGLKDGLISEKDSHFKTNHKIN
jgi:hypothetical protein